MQSLSSLIIVLVHILLNFSLFTYSAILLLSLSLYTSTLFFLSFHIIIHLILIFIFSLPPHPFPSLFFGFSCVLPLFCSFTLCSFLDAFAHFHSLICFHQQIFQWLSKIHVILCGMCYVHKALAANVMAMTRCDTRHRREVCKWSPLLLAGPPAPPCVMFVLGTGVDDARKLWVVLKASELFLSFAKSVTPSLLLSVELTFWRWLSPVSKPPNVRPLLMLLLRRVMFMWWVLW